MKQEASKKSKKWLWLVIGLVLVLAIVGTVLALFLGGGKSSGDDVEQSAGGRPALYWNVGRLSNVDPETGMSTRQAAADGLYYIKFAYNGEQVEHAVSDKKLVNYIDAMDIMGLIFDNEGIVVDVINPDDIAHPIGKNIYVQSVSDNVVVANSSIAMNGMRYNINITELTEIYEVSGSGEFEGVKINADNLLPMDTITVYANGEEGEVTHIFLSNHPVDSKIYWRATQQWNSTEKITSRVPDENGDYLLDFFCDGELVYFKTKDVTIVNKVDDASRYSAHFGLRFDEDGYVVEAFSATSASRLVLVCQRFDITEFDGTNFTANRLLTNDGSFYSGTLNEDCAIYDVSKASISERRQGKAVDTLQIGDRVCVWVDAAGNPALIYIANRIVDSPAYYVPTRKYNSTLQETTREPNAQGYYEINLLKEGDSKDTIYRTKDKALMTEIDKENDKVVGLAVDENNNILHVYEQECLFGYSSFCLGRYVSDVSGVIASFLLPSDMSVKNGILKSTCKIYNVSKEGEYGAETTLQVGDYIYCWKDPIGEIVHMYVLRRYVGEDTQYYCLDTEYDTEAQCTTRTPDADGWYHLTMAHMGKKIVLKTKDIKIVNAIDSLRSSVPVVSLKVSGDVITDVLDGTYATGGGKVASGYRIKSFNEDGSVTAYSSTGKETTFTPADNVQIYNVSQVVESHRGEKATLKIGDRITAYTNWEGKAAIVWILGRQVDNMYWKLDRFYNSTDEVTTRVPDADGWYWYDLAVNGECKKFKTNDITIANSIDSYERAFGLHVVGDVIKGFATVSNVKDASGNGVTNWTVSKIKGNQITVTYTYSGSENTGKSQVITLSDNAKIYDVSGAVAFGSKAKLKVGDIICTYLGKDGESHQYAYIRAHCTRKEGYMSYCDHCDQVVYWNPIIRGGSMSKYDSHYYLPSDITNIVQITVGTKQRDFETVLDLNGNTLTRTNGRAFLVRYGDKLTIIDTVGGGKIVGSGNNTIGGAIYLSTGNLDLYAGTITMVDDEQITASHGGCVYVSGSESVFNMYGGELTGGRVFPTSSTSGSRGGNLCVSAGVFNMYGGKITDGKAFEAEIQQVDEAGNVIMEGGVPVTKTGHAYGGNIYLGSGGTLNIEKGTVSGGWSEYYGGNIYSGSASGNLIVKKATVSNGEALRGGNIYGTGTVTLTGATITGGVAGQRGGNIAPSNGTWLLNGGTKITGGVAGSDETSGYGGNVVISTANVTVADATIDGGKVGRSGNGGNIYCLYEGVLNITKGATISNGTSKGSGGNIYVGGAQKSSATGSYDRRFTVNISGGTVTGGTSTGGNGGNICMNGYSADADGDGTKEFVGGSYLYISGGEISNGTCADDKYGGNIYMVVDDAVISGGSIFGGKQGESDYDIYLAEDCSTVAVTGGNVAGRFRVYSANGISVSGKPVLGRLDLYKNVLVDVGQLKQGASIAVVTASSTTNGVITLPFNNAQAYLNAGYFTAADADKIIDVYGGNQLCIVRLTLVDPNAVTAYCEHCEQDVLWSTWDYYSGSGHYYVDDAWTLVNSPITIEEGEDIIIDLKGQTITAQDDRAFYVYGTLSIVDSVGGGMVTGTGPSSGISSGGVIYLNSADSVLNLYSGILKMTDTNYSTSGGGVLYVKGTFNMYGGELAGGVSNGNPDSTNFLAQKGRGGNIYVIGGTANLIGGRMHSGVAGVGGNIYCGSSGIVNLIGTEVSGGTASYRSDNIYCESGTLNISGGSIIGSTGEYNAYLTSSSLTVNISGGTIDGTVRLASVSSVEISGAPTINNLSVKSGIIVNLGEMTGGSIGVTADGVFTNAVSNASDYLSYFTAKESGMKVTTTISGELTVIADTGNDEDIIDPTQTPYNDVYANAVQMTTNGVFDGGDTVTAPCPYCSANGDTADKQWNALGATGQVDGGHYYLAENKSENDASYTIKGNVCLHLNGKFITCTARAFYVDSTGTLNVMGAGNVIGAYKGSSDHTAATLDSIGKVNLCGGNWMRANDAPVIDGRGSSINGTINIYNGTTVQGDSNYTGYALIALYNKTEMNMYGGTITGGTWTDGTGGNIYIKPNTNSSRVTALNVYGGTISNGSAAQGGNIYAEGGTSNVQVNIAGGTITGGSVYVAKNVSSLTISGVPVIENLDLSDGAVINLGTLTTGADINVTADGVFTNAVSNASDYLSYFTAKESGMKVAATIGGELTVIDENSDDEEIILPSQTPYNDVYANAVQMTTNGVFDNAGVVNASCPYCDPEGASPVEWKELEFATATTTLNSGHYYLSGDLEDANLYKVTGGSVCIHLNGHNITAASTQRAFYVESSGELTVMGDGTVSGSRQSATSAHLAATLDSIGTVNLCGGTWVRTSNAPVIGGRGTSFDGTISIYDGTTIQGDSNYTGYALVAVYNKTTLNIYGGTITGGTNTSGNGGNIIVIDNGNSGRTSNLNIYGGTITGGSAALGGNIYIDGGVSVINVNIAGGTITGGSVYVANDVSSLTIFGAPVIENLDLSDGTVINLSTLTTGADIDVTADGVFTGALTNANGYLAYIGAYETGKVVEVTSDNALSVAG